MKVSQSKSFQDKVRHFDSGRCRIFEVSKERDRARFSLPAIGEAAAICNINFPNI